MSATDDPAVVNDHRADGDPPFAETLHRLINRSLEKWIAHRPSEAVEEHQVENSARAYCVACDHDFHGSLGVAKPRRVKTHEMQ